MRSSDSLLSQLHLSAVQKEAAMAPPTVKDEAWRYTDLSLYLKDSFLPLEGYSWVPGMTLPPQAKDLIAGSEDLLVFYNGQHVPHLSRAPHVQFRLLKEWQNKDLEVCFADVDAADNFIRFRNAAQLAEGVAIEVEKGAQVRLHLLHLYGKPQKLTPPPSFQVVFRTQLYVEPEANVTLTETHLAVEDALFLANAVTDVFVKEKAQVNYLRLHETGDRGLFINQTSLFQKATSMVDFTQMTLGGRLVRNEAAVHLEQSGAEARLDGVTLAKKSHHVDNSTSVFHLVGETVSDQLYKNFLSDECRVVFNGRLVIHEDAQKSDARQLNQNLVMGDRAEVDTRPQLEVFADDVKAAHGASIGQLDEDQLFYLMSRGISRTQAVHMLAEGFLEDVLERMTSATLKQRAREVLRSSFPSYIGWVS